MAFISLIERQHDDRITALHQNSVYAVGLPVRREMSLVMRSMPQLPHIFRFMESSSSITAFPHLFLGRYTIRPGSRLTRCYQAFGHDLLGRSTAKNLLLLWTACFKNITFTEQFIVDGSDHALYGLAVDNALRTCLNFNFSQTRLKESLEFSRSGRRVIRDC